jgi:hypothetical protein
LGNWLDNLTNSDVTEYSIGGKFEQMEKVKRLQVTGNRQQVQMVGSDGCDYSNEWEKKLERMAAHIMKYVGWVERFLRYPTKPWCGEMLGFAAHNPTDDYGWVRKNQITDLA